MRRPGEGSNRRPAGGDTQTNGVVMVAINRSTAGNAREGARSHVPLELRERPQWVVWRNEDGTKVPYDARSGRKASSTDPSTWTTYDRACQAYDRARPTNNAYTGVGFVFTADDPFVGIDLDDCIVAPGELTTDAQTIVDRMQTYTEVSPSGAGLKLWVRGSLPRNVKTPSVEVYTQARYFTVTGRRWPGTPAEIRAVNGELDALYESLRPAQPAQADPRPLPQATADADHARRWCLAALEGEHQKMLSALEGERHNRRYNSAYALGGLIHTGGLTAQEITEALGVNFGPNAHGAMQTIADGIVAGQEAPRDIPPPIDRMLDGFRLSDTVTAETIVGNPEAERWRQEALYWRMCAEHLQRELTLVKEQNRFVTETHSAENIGTPSKRLSFIELTKEIERVPVEERTPDQFIHVRPGYMASRTGQNRTTVSRHLDEFAKAGLIEKKLERSFDPETNSWCSELYVRPIVDLSDPSQVTIPSKPRGKAACTACGSEKLVREIRIVCGDCRHELSFVQEFVNAPPTETLSEVQSALQADVASEAAESNSTDTEDQDAASETVSEVQSALQDFDPQASAKDIVPIGLKCRLHHKELTTVDESPDVQIALQGSRPPKADRFVSRSQDPEAWLTYLEQTGRADEAAKYRAKVAARR